MLTALRVVKVLGSVMDESFVWIVLPALVIAFPVLVVAFNERRLRRREKALGTRRKKKIRL